MKEALRNCGHPEWSLKEQKSKKKDKTTKQDDTIGRVTIPYVNRLSEQIARVLKKHRIQTAHRPIQTIASTLHTKKKDRIHDLDKAESTTTNASYAKKIMWERPEDVGERGNVSTD